MFVCIKLRERSNSDFLEETRSEKEFGEKQFEDSRLIPTPRYYGRFPLTLGKALTLSLNSTHALNAPVNVDNGHLFLAHVYVLLALLAQAVTVSKFEERPGKYNVEQIKTLLKCKGLKQSGK